MSIREAKKLNRQQRDILRTAIAVVAVTSTPAAALADRWSPLQAEIYKPGLGACQSEGDRTACLVVRCDQTSGLQLVLFDDGEGGPAAEELTIKIGKWSGRTTFIRMTNGDLSRKLELKSPLLSQLVTAREVNIHNLEWGYDFKIRNVSGGDRLRSFVASCGR